jgi:hypothetical protein
MGTLRSPGFAGGAVGLDMIASPICSTGGQFNPDRSEASGATIFPPEPSDAARPWLEEELSVLDKGFESLIQLSSGMNAVSSYKKQIKSIRKLRPKVTTRIELNQTVVKAPANTTAEDERVIQTLDGLVPSAALSYRQPSSTLPMRTVCHSGGQHWNYVRHCAKRSIILRQIAK